MVKADDYGLIVAQMKRIAMARWKRPASKSIGGPAVARSLLYEAPPAPLS